MCADLDRQRDYRNPWLIVVSTSQVSQPQQQQDWSHPGPRLSSSQVPQPGKLLSVICWQWPLHSIYLIRITVHLIHLILHIHFTVYHYLYLCSHCLSLLQSFTPVSRLACSTNHFLLRNDLYNVSIRMFKRTQLNVDIRALWRSALSVWVLRCQKLQMIA